MNQEYECNFHAAAAPEFSECDQFSLWGNRECFASGFDTEADFNSSQKREGHGVLVEHYLNKAITWPYCTD